jgi:hypothetical protein
MSLEKLLKEKYNISEAESNQASKRLVDLFKIFYQVDSRQKQEKLIEMNDLKEYFVYKIVIID